MTKPIHGSIVSSFRSKHNRKFETIDPCITGTCSFIPPHDHNIYTKRMRINVIRSRAHNIYTEKINKVALSCEDDKRFICEDGVHTLALKRYKISCF